MHMVKIHQRFIPVSFDTGGNDDAVAAIITPAVGKCLNFFDDLGAQGFARSRIIGHLIQAVQQHHARAGIQRHSQKVGQFSGCSACELNADGVQQEIIEGKPLIPGKRLGVVSRPHHQGNEWLIQSQSSCAVAISQH